MILEFFKYIGDQIMAFIPTYSDYPFPPEMVSAMESVFEFIKVFTALPLVSSIAEIFWAFTIPIAIALILMRVSLLVIGLFTPTNVSKDTI